jgi:lipoyl(octanoyl) transferase
MSANRPRFFSSGGASLSHCLPIAIRIQFPIFVQLRKGGMDRKGNIQFRDLGKIGYGEAWDIQERHFQKLVEFKRRPDGGTHPGQFLFFCEHPHVYTLGKSGDEANLLISSEFLEKIQAAFFRTNRGGDITYHGPGQIVGYPILDLEVLDIGLKQYVNLLEASIIELLAVFGIKASRLEGATGVWLDAGHPVKARKICAIGVRSSRHVTMHGFALNVNTQLDYFSYIHPCGFETKGVTSMEKELEHMQDIERVKAALREILLRNFLPPGTAASAAFHGN